MTSQRLVEQFARYLWERDVDSWAAERGGGDRVPDSYMDEAAVFLAGELGQRLQRVGRGEAYSEGWAIGYRLAVAEKRHGFNSDEAHDLANIGNPYTQDGAQS